MTEPVVGWATEPADREACLEIRRRVFIEEQGVPFQDEIDGLDDACAFALARLDGRPVGCLRLREVGAVVKVERVATLEGARGQGVASALLDLAEAALPGRHPARLAFLHAQAGALGLYARRGYAPVGAPFDESDIPHQAMARLIPADGRPIRLEPATGPAAPSAAIDLVHTILREHGFEPEAYDRDLEDLGDVYGQGAFYLLWRGEEIVGTGAWAPIPDEPGAAEVRRMFLAPPARGLAIGRQLLTFLELDAAYHGYGRAILETASSLVAALGLYRSVGYADVDGEMHTTRCDLRLARALPLAPIH